MKIDDRILELLGEARGGKMKKRKQKKIIIPIQLYEAEYKGKEDIYWMGHIVKGTDSKKCQIADVKHNAGG